MELMGVLFFIFLTLPVVFGYALIFICLFSAVVMVPICFFLKDNNLLEEGAFVSKSRSEDLFQISNTRIKAKKHNKILLIEDDLSLRPMWLRIFNNISSGFDLEWAVSGEHAQTMINQANRSRQHYHLIIADLFLAGPKTGMDVLLSEEVANSQSQRVLVSAVKRREMKKNTDFKKIKTHFIPKPLNIRICEKVMGKLLTN